MSCDWLLILTFRISFLTFTAREKIVNDIDKSLILGLKRKNLRYVHAGKF